MTKGERGQPRGYRSNLLDRLRVMATLQQWLWDEATTIADEILDCELDAVLDQLPDLVANGGDDTLWLYFGKGDGTFNLPIILPITKGQTPMWLATADIEESASRTSLSRSLTATASECFSGTVTELLSKVA